MDIRQLRYFVAIADQHSMSLASEKLGVAQPSLSHHIMRIEEELGVQLLVRSTRGVTLTENGSRLYEHARNIIQAVEVAVADLRDQAGDLCGPVGFAFPSSVSNVLTVPLIETVRNEFPKIVPRAMDATSGQIQTWLSDGSIDFGILYEGNCARDLHVLPLLVETLYLVAAHDAWKGEIGKTGVAKEAVSLKDCGGLALVLPHREQGLRELLERFAEAEDVRLEVVMEMELAEPHQDAGVARLWLFHSRACGRPRGVGAGRTGACADPRSADAPHRELGDQSEPAGQTRGQGSRAAYARYRRGIGPKGLLARGTH